MDARSLNKIRSKTILHSIYQTALRDEWSRCQTFKAFALEVEILHPIREYSILL